MPERKTRIPKETQGRTNELLKAVYEKVEDMRISINQLRDIIVQDYLHHDDSVSGAAFHRYFAITGTPSSPKAEVTMALQEWLSDNQ